MSLSELYFEFIESLDALGRIAKSELSHCDFTDDDEKVAKESIKEFKEKLAKVEAKLNKVEVEAIRIFDTDKN